LGEKEVFEVRVEFPPKKKSLNTFNMALARIEQVWSVFLPPTEQYQASWALFM
jgi:hypothetical protein